MKRMLPVLSLIWLTGCGPAADDRLIIATAANLQFAMKEIQSSFTAKTGITCDLTVSSSGKLAAQIMEGAPYDIFLSADMSHPARLAALNLTRDTVMIYAYGKLVLWTKQEGLLPELASLNQATVSHIAVANPDIAPYGKAAFQVMRTHGINEHLKDKLVFGESISQVNQFVVAGAAEIGFTSKSAVLSADLAKLGQWVELDDQSYEPIVQGMVLLKNGRSPEEHGRKFLEFIFSTEGRGILERYGYQSP